MSEIEEYQRRISAALDRIGQQLDAQSAGGDDAARVSELTQALDDEKLANEQLEERVKAMRAKRDALEAEVSALRSQNSDTLSTLDHQLQSLRRANDQLRDNNAALRAANAEGVGEPHLINKSMMAELDSLRASRDLDRAETGSILAELSAAIEGATGAPNTAEEDA